MPRIQKRTYYHKIRRILYFGLLKLSNNIQVLALGFRRVVNLYFVEVLLNVINGLTVRRMAL